MNINIYSIILLVISAVAGFGAGFIAKKISDDDSRIVKIKIIIKSISLLGIVSALLISIYL